MLTNQNRKIHLKEKKSDLYMTKMTLKTRMVSEDIWKQSENLITKLDFMRNI